VLRQAGNRHGSRESDGTRPRRAWEWHSATRGFDRSVAPALCGFVGALGRAGSGRFVRYHHPVAESDFDSQGSDGSSAESIVPERGTAGANGRECAALLATIVVALGVRAACVVASSTVPSARHLIGDAAGYYDWALRIAGGEWIGHDAFYQAPLYPYVLAVILKIAGPGVAILRWTQVVWGALGAGCLYLGTRRWFDRKTALIAGVMMACYAPAVFFDGVIQKASLASALLCALIALLPYTPGRVSSVRYSAIGLLMGLLTLTRENTIVWVPIVAVWLFLRVGRRSVGAPRHGAKRFTRLERTPGDAQRRGAANVALYAIGLAIALVPVAIHNAALGGGWSISTFQAGPNFYIGNHAGASGRYVPLVRGHETPVFERTDATTLAEGDVGHALSQSDVSRYWFGRAWSDIRHHPLDWVRLLIRKMDLTWNRYEIPDAESLYVYAATAPVLGVLGSVWHFGVLCPLAAVGLIASRRRWRDLWVLYALMASMACSVALFYVMARYRFPLVPLLIPFAAAGVGDITRRVRSHEFRRLATRLAVALGVAFVVNRRIQAEPRLNALAWMNVGVSLAEAGELEAAVIHFRAAVETFPSSAEANNNLAQALAVLDRHGAAIPYYRAARAVAPDLPGVDYNLGVSLERVGRVREALEHYERAVVADRDDAEAKAAVRRLRAADH